MTKLRQLELLISLSLNSKQKFLLNFQKKNLISKSGYLNSKEERDNPDRDFDKADPGSSSSEEEHNIY